MHQDFNYQWGRIVARAWSDAAFKAKLLADPAGVLMEYGVLAPPGLQLKVVENTDKVVHFVLPVKPPPQELSEEEMHRVVGGYSGTSGGTCGEGCEWGRCLTTQERCEAQ